MCLFVYAKIKKLYIRFTIQKTSINAVKPVPEKFTIYVSSGWDKEGEIDDCYKALACHVIRQAVNDYLDGDNSIHGFFFNENDDLRALWFSVAELEEDCIQRYLIDLKKQEKEDITVEEFKQFRLMNKWSQAVLAGRLATSGTTISNIEIGKRGINSKIKKRFIRLKNIMKGVAKC